jgi:hypothetical protein
VKFYGFTAINVCQQGSTYQLVIAADLASSYALFVYDSVNVDVLVPDVFSGVKSPLKCISDWHATSFSNDDITEIVQSVTSEYF